MKHSGFILVMVMLFMMMVSVFAYVEIESSVLAYRETENIALHNESFKAAERVLDSIVAYGPSEGSGYEGALYYHYAINTFDEDPCCQVLGAASLGAVYYLNTVEIYPQDNIPPSIVLSSFNVKPMQESECEAAIHSESAGRKGWWTLK